MLGIVVALRLLTLGLYPLTDPTEARYAEMARKMLDTGNWLTPMFDVGVPFWGKPPLAFWMSALPMALAGASEFTARLGPLLATALVLYLLGQWPQSPQHHRNDAKIIANKGLFVMASLVFLSTPLGFVYSGAVMTDMAMVVGTTLSMVAFWRAVAAAPSTTDKPAVGRGYWPWLFFAGQAIGLLAKGPVAVVLTGLPVAAWVLWHGAWRATWQRLPWWRGGLLVAVLVLPWYVMAEQATPGFLRYFLVGEHWYRFTQSGWKGDLYGVAHAQPKGRIWLFAVASVLPWLLAAAGWAFSAAPVSAATVSVALQPPGERAYLLCWALAPCVFFTLSGNILPSYVLPGLPAFALLLARQWQARAALNSGVAAADALVTAVCALVTPLAFTVLLFTRPDQIAAYSDKSLLQGIPPAQVVYLLERTDSGMFYTRGQVRRALTPEAIQATLTDPSVTRLLLPRGKLSEWQRSLQAYGWREVGRNALTIAFSPTPTP